MTKKPKTTSEHLISLYGYITGLKREVSQIKNNHLKHIHDDVDKIKELWSKHKLCVICAVVAFVLGGIII